VDVAAGVVVTAAGLGDGDGLLGGGLLGGGLVGDSVGVDDGLGVVVTYSTTRDPTGADPDRGDWSTTVPGVPVLDARYSTNTVNPAPRSVVVAPADCSPVVSGTWLRPLA